MEQNVKIGNDKKSCSDVVVFDEANDKSLALMTSKRHVNDKYEIRAIWGPNLNGSSK